MVNFRDPVIIALDSWALVKLYHTLDGLYIWEFFTSIDYEWRIIRGRVPYRWMIWIYSLTRIATLMTAIINLITLNKAGQMNCQAWATSSFMFAYTTFASSSLLIILRIIAIWNKNKVIVGLASIIWTVNLSFLIQGAIKIRSTWIPFPGICSTPDVERTRATIISMFITDILLLVVMFIGLLRMRLHAAGTFGLGRLLWKQGIAWLLLAAVVELPSLIFIYLNLNEAFNIMFLLPSHIMMSIAATRMYRSLADFCSNDVVDSGTPRYPPRIGLAVQNSKATFAMSTLPGRMEVAVHTAHEKYPPSLGGEDRPIQLLCDKQDELSCDRVDDMGSSV